MKARRSAAARYDQQNEMAATIILGDIEKYGGEGSLMVRWARLFMERSEAPPADWEAGPLFQQRAA